MDISFRDAKWIWHPEWSESLLDTAGAFVHFRKVVDITAAPTPSLKIQISADTRYKLYVNAQLVSCGPVKGDQHLWFYDEVDIGPYLQQGTNVFAVRVLRFFHATSYATSFPRLQFPGLVIRHNCPQEHQNFVSVATNASWQTAVDKTTRLPVDMAEDDFLHIYEAVDNSASTDLLWVSAKILDFPSSHGLTAPWKLSPRLIPTPISTPCYFKTLHTLQSPLPILDFEKVLLARGRDAGCGILLKAGTRHHIELEADHHSTALISFRFHRPLYGGATLRVKYSECYEDQPVSVPYLRKKGDRRDSSKQLFGPEDTYRFGGKMASCSTHLPMYDAREPLEESFSPFHMRTFRLLTVDIQVPAESDLLWLGIEAVMLNYPLNIQASFETRDTRHAETYERLWATSIRTLRNCMHDTYEDCPFYEQLQYVMDTRSSILFTYCISGDDRLARQAIRQIHNTYAPSIGLTASRAPAHQTQVIPHFSLYWICMVADHHRYFGDADFVRQFGSACDGVLETFARSIDPEYGLIRHDANSPHWDFVDWTDSWRPMGIPPAGSRSGFLSYTNMLYAYTLRETSPYMRSIGRPGLADEYMTRAEKITTTLKAHCFDGRFFTDGLAHQCNTSADYSQQTQILAVLSGTATDELAVNILEQSLSPTGARPLKFSPASTAMSFYLLRALALAGPALYDRQFHQFWGPWVSQLEHNLSTWEEDSVSQRSDCHAWGCAVLYEITAEVAGVSPGAPGWSKIAFRPRIRLFRDFKAVVPYGGDCGRRGLAAVEWVLVEADRRFAVSLRLTPDQPSETASLSERCGHVAVDMQVYDAHVDTVEHAGDTRNGCVLRWVVTLS